MTTIGRVVVHYETPLLFLYISKDDTYLGRSWESPIQVLVWRGEHAKDIPSSGRNTKVVKHLHVLVLLVPLTLLVGINYCLGAVAERTSFHTSGQTDPNSSSSQAPQLQLGVL